MSVSRGARTLENTDCQDQCSCLGKGPLKVKRTSGVMVVEAAWTSGLLVRAQGAGGGRERGVVLPRLLADRRVG